MSELNLKGKVAVVTGASQGLGEALAMRLDKEGCKVAVCDINYDGAQAVASKLSDAMALAVDVTKYDQLEAAAKAVIEKWGKVDVLICNAAIVKSGDIFNLSPEAFGLPIVSTPPFLTTKSTFSAIVSEPTVTSVLISTFSLINTGSSAPGIRLPAQLFASVQIVLSPLKTYPPVTCTDTGISTFSYQSPLSGTNQAVAVCIPGRRIVVGVFHST